MIIKIKKLSDNIKRHSVYQKKMILPGIEVALKIGAGIKTFGERQKEDIIRANADTLGFQMYQQGKIAFSAPFCSDDFSFILIRYHLCAG